MTDGYGTAWDFLREFFNYNHYQTSIERIRRKLSTQSRYWSTWLLVKQLVEDEALLPGQPLKLVQEGANRVLDENSDAEAYVWLKKMVRNVERADGKLEEY